MSKPNIHETAVVSPNADIDAGVTIGAHAIIESDVEIGAGTVLGPHAIVRQYSRIGKDNIIDSTAVIGGLPQHTGFDGSKTWLVMGDGNVIREGVTINRAFEPGAVTTIGSNCYLMANSHVGHDCQVGNNVVLTNGVILAGHVEVGRNAVFGGYAGAIQFSRVGAYSMVAGYAPLRKDVIPFSMIGGDPIRHYRLNTIGLRRGGIDKERYRTLERAFKALRKGDKELTDIPDTEDILELREWLGAKSQSGIYGFAKPKRR